MSSTKFFTAILCSAVLACNQTSKPSGSVSKIDTPRSPTTSSTVVTTPKGDSLNENEAEENIVDTIFNLPEVIKRAKYIEQRTKGKRHLKVWIEDTPHLRDRKYYWVKVGEDNGSSLVTHFNFYVYPDSMRIMYYDIDSDKQLTLFEWRKINGM